MSTDEDFGNKYTQLQERQAAARAQRDEETKLEHEFFGRAIDKIKLISALIDGLGMPQIRANVRRYPGDVIVEAKDNHHFITLARWQVFLSRAAMTAVGRDESHEGEITMESVRARVMKGIDATLNNAPKTKD